MGDSFFVLGNQSLLLLLLPVLWALIPVSTWVRERRAVARQSLLEAADSAEPPSLHPKIDHGLCVGCGACANACPEGKIIDMIGHKAYLTDPMSCIGHGACKTVCPVGAIELVFGSSRRGVDIPVVSSKFESNVPGLYIAGELGGMGLIANAIEQGRQSIDSIAHALSQDHRRASGSMFDVVIVGGGPAGISASLAAQEKGLKYLTLEQESLGGTVAHYPRGKLVMTRPAFLPRHGKVHLRRVRKEQLLTLWRDVIGKWQIDIYQGRVDGVDARPEGGLNVVIDGKADPVPARTVLLATGRRGSPNRLGIPGEDLHKVVYKLSEPEQYRDHHVAVVGGGDSALEAATALVGYAASVTLCHRGESFNRTKAGNRKAFEAARNAHKIKVLTRAQVRVIERTHIVIDQTGADGRETTLSIPNTAVIICAGGTLPTALLTAAGVRVETKYGTV